MPSEEKIPSKQILPAYTYYYGFTKAEIIKLATLPYKEALEFKCRSSKKLLKHLLDRPFTEHDTSRINDILKSIKFNEELLKELEH